MEDEQFIFCLEAVPDVETDHTTEVVRALEQLALRHDITTIYKTCDTIEGLEESLNALLYDDHNFKNYEIIYLVVPGEPNNIEINNYFYSIEEIAEFFEGKMNGKIIHFANNKILDLSDEESQYFLNITGARAVSGYGISLKEIPSYRTLDIAFFSLFQEHYDLKEVVEELFQKHYKLCKLLDFRLYY